VHDGAGMRPVMLSSPVKCDNKCILEGKKASSEVKKQSFIVTRTVSAKWGLGGNKRKKKK